MRSIGFINLELANEAETNIKKLAIGRIDAMIESKWIDNYLWKDLKDIIIGPDIGEVQYIYPAAGLDFPPEFNR